MKEKILIVEDEFIVANDLAATLEANGYSVCGIAASVEIALKMLEKERPDFVLVDIMLGSPVTGIELGKELQKRGLPFLYISANTNQKVLEAAKQTQPYGFLVKPFREIDLFIMLDIARYRHGIENSKFKNAEPVVSRPVTTDNIIGESPRFREAIHKLRLVAPTNTSVLLLGESGTGKERAARSIHQWSARHAKPLVTINCAGLPDTLLESELFGYEKGSFTGAQQRRTGKFEQASGGTVFLDEIGELSLDAQIKLLRVLQERQIERIGGDRPVNVDVRIIAATNRNLEKEVAQGKFRLDLYYRLNVFPVELPPLRERAADIEPLAFFFLEKFSRASNKRMTGFSDDVLGKLRRYNWPGNIRELEHLIEREVIMATGTTLNKIDMPRVTASAGSVPDEGNANATLQSIEKEYIMKVLKQCKGKVSGPGGAAEILGLPVQTLFSKLKKLGIRSSYGYDQ